MKNTRKDGQVTQRSDKRLKCAPHNNCYCAPHNNCYCDPHNNCYCDPHNNCYCDPRNNCYCDCLSYTKPANPLYESALFFTTQK